jgi:acetyl-CoA carboxylase, biotin carboxylase subunit
MPSPGRITRWSIPEGAGVRVDTHGYEGYLVPPFYDSLLAKVIGRGEDRESAIAATLGAIERTEIGGVATNLELHRFLLAHADFRAARVSTRWLETTALPQYRRRRRLAS